MIALGDEHINRCGVASEPSRGLTDGSERDQGGISAGATCAVLTVPCTADKPAFRLYQTPTCSQEREAAHGFAHVSPSYLIMLAVSATACFSHYQHIKKESKLFVRFSIVSKPESRLYKMFFFCKSLPCS